MLSSLQAYSYFVYSLPERYPSVRGSTLIVIPLGATMGPLRGIIEFDGAISAKHSGIKHNRIPAPGISFDQPNLPFLIEEIEYNLLSS